MFLADSVFSHDANSVHRVIRDYAKLIFVRNFPPYLSSQFAGVIILYLYHCCHVIVLIVLILLCL